MVESDAAGVPDGNAMSSTLMSLLAATSSAVSAEETSSIQQPGSTFSDGLLQKEDQQHSDASTTPSVEQKMFLVMSVALATVCFFTNAVQIAVFLQRGTVRNVKNVLLLSQAMSGLLASQVVDFPIHVISSKGGPSASESGFNLCYLGHSGIILMTLLTSLSTATLLLLDHHLHRHHNQNLAGWTLAIIVVWIWAAIVSSLPWFGWNTWLAHDAKCHLSTLWPLSFTTFVTFLVAIHVALALLMWASARAGTQHHTPHTRLRAGQQAAVVSETGSVQEEEPTVHAATASSEGCVRLAGWLISLSSVVPVLGHVVLASSCAASTQCMQSARHYHEDSASLPWASLLLAAAAVANPLLYIFSDDQVSSATLQLLTRGCCTKPKASSSATSSPSSGSASFSNTTTGISSGGIGSIGGGITSNNKKPKGNNNNSSCGGGGWSNRRADRNQRRDEGLQQQQQVNKQDQSGASTYVTSSDTQHLVGDT